MLRRLGTGGDSDEQLWRVEFRLVPGGDPRSRLAADDQLADADLASITRQLDRLDQASRTGPWTLATLTLIAERPGVVSTELAEALGHDRPSFKLDVRKLKALGPHREPPRRLPAVAARPASFSAVANTAASDAH